MLGEVKEKKMMEIVTEREGSKIKKVMVAIDENEYSYNALMWALENLKELAIATEPLLIFASHSSPNHGPTLSAPIGLFGFYAPLSPSLELTSSIQERNKNVTIALLEKAKSMCANKGVKAETIMEFGEPKELICNAILKNEIDLLIIGDEASSILKRVFQGSISSYCVNNAKCPVLVVMKHN